MFGQPRVVPHVLERESIGRRAKQAAEQVDEQRRTEVGDPPALKELRETPRVDKAEALVRQRWNLVWRTTEYKDEENHACHTIRTGDDWEASGRHLQNRYRRRVHGSFGRRISPGPYSTSCPASSSPRAQRARPRTISPSQSRTTRQAGLASSEIVH